MDIIKSLLTALGINSTVWLQLASFLVSYLALSNLVFKPYLKAYRERERRTVGGEESAVRTVEEAQQLQLTYEQRAKHLNSEIRSVYEAHRSEATKQYEKQVEAARAEAAEALDSARQKISTEVQAARKSLSAEIPAVSRAIASRLSGKELSV